MEKEEQEWELQEQEAAPLIPRRSKSTFQNGDSLVTDDASNGNGNSENNGHHHDNTILAPSNNFYSLVEAISSTVPAPDINGVDQHHVLHPDQQKIDALTHTQAEIHLSKEAQVTDTQNKDDTSVYYHPDEGTQLDYTFSGEEHVGKSLRDEPLDVSTRDLNVQEIFNSNLLSLPHSEIVSEEYGTSNKSLEINEIENGNGDFDLINESSLEETEIDLEKVLGKQNTHDLFCPNCNSCITRRVILRKRKRGVRITSEDVKRNKPEAAVGSSFNQDHRLASNDQIHDSAEIHSDGTPELAVNDHEHERKPDIFRCLSCFSFFIPTGNGFKIFQMFEKKDQRKPIQDPEKPASKSWISSIFGSHQEPTSEPGRDIRSDDSLTSSSKESGLPSSFVNAESFSKQKDLLPSREFEDPAKSAGAESHNGGEKISHNLTKEHLSNGKETPIIGHDSKNTIEMNKGDSTTNHFEAVAGSQTSTSNDPSDVLDYQQSSIVAASADSIPVVNGKLPENDGTADDGRGLNHDENSQPAKSIANGIYPGELLKTNKDPSVSSVKDLHFVEGGTTNIIKDLGKATAQLNTGRDLVLVVEPETVHDADSQLPRDLIISEETEVSLSVNTVTSVTERRGGEDRESYGVEIIKSIVYGGLIESIVSLGVVSSAAGGGTPTLNIATLSLANLIGGLVIVLHNLWELKKDKMVTGSDQQQQEIDRYQELLGRRSNFLLHATIVILSFLIFGLITPITYFVSFRNSDIPSRLRISSRYLKVAATASAALACIVLLATGKAYVRRPPKSYLKTIAYFFLMGVMVSGISYAVGELLLPFFHSNSLLYPTLPPPPPTTTTTPSSVAVI